MSDHFTITAGERAYLLARGWFEQEPFGGGDLLWTDPHSTDDDAWSYDAEDALRIQRRRDAGFLATHEGT